MAFYSQHLRCAPLFVQKTEQKQFNFTRNCFVELMVNNCVVLRTELLEMPTIISIFLDSKDFTDFLSGN